MEQAPRKPASLISQSHALMKKNLLVQKRKMLANVLLILFPALGCLALGVIDQATGGGNQMSDIAEETAEPEKTLPLFQIPRPEYRATRGNNIADPNYYPDIPRDVCRERGTCPVSILFTGMNRATAEKLAQGLYGSETLTEPSDSLDLQTMASKFILGTYKTDSPETADVPTEMFKETGLEEEPDDSPLYIVQQSCKRGLTFHVPMKINESSTTRDVECVNGLHLWREKYEDIIRELSSGFVAGNSDQRIDEFLGAYDFLNTDERTFNVTVWCNKTDEGSTQIPRAINAASNSYLQTFRGSHVQMLLDFVRDTPKGEESAQVQGAFQNFLFNSVRLQFFLWIIHCLVPVILSALVYEKQRKLRMIMKMHGLGDFAYWMISYAYFLLLSCAYMLSFALVGYIVGIALFKLNHWSVQFVFFFAFVNVQIAFAMLLSTFFSRVKTASVVGFIYVFGASIVAIGTDMMTRLSDSSKTVVRATQLIPSVALCRGLNELLQYAEEARVVGEIRSDWNNIAKDEEGLLTTLAIMIIELPVLLLIAYYLDQVGANGSGVRKHPLWFLPCFQGRLNAYEQNQGHEILVSLEKSDVSQEREKVGRLLQDSVQSHLIIVDDLRKTYPPRDGNPVKHAVQGLSLAIAKGECFGMLGPNGAGKTSFLSMMTGLTTPTSGAAYIDGLNIREDMDKVYTRMGVCPQHDLLWEVLTGREHLYFYGRLKNLKGAELSLAVEESLASVNMSEKGDKRAGSYSGGMKRRLSVAISFIGNPKVVYLDEPSTGLDPASRKSLWGAVVKAKENKSIILTTHSMEEAEFLCDRIGIFVDGNLQCIGHPKEIRARFGGYYLLTITAPSGQEDEVEKFVRDLCQSANKVYQLSGTQKYHLPKQEVAIADVFREVGNAKRRIDVQDWSVATATLEDVFIKVANNARPSST